MKEKQKNTRAKIFHDGTKQIKISTDLFAKIEEEAQEKRLFPSQVVDIIVRNYYLHKKN